MRECRPTHWEWRMSSNDGPGKTPSRVWIASADGSAPPRAIAEGLFATRRGRRPQDTDWSASG
jgi:hypothetical protein